MSVLIYVEGGHHGQTKTACRQAFRRFFEKVIPPGSFQVRASGDRASTFQDFRAALEKHANDYVILLVDSEEAVTTGCWQHLRARTGDGWHQPVGTVDDQVHLMVQVMEAWFLADKPKLIAYYGQGFLDKSLPGQPNVELISKQDVFRILQHASRPTQKGEYHKTRHAFDLLEEIDPSRVRTASQHAARLFAVLARETGIPEI
ncbi:MAG: DUF4276 family protein [Candidatus Acidiferrum sp.]